MADLLRIHLMEQVVVAAAQVVLASTLSHRTKVAEAALAYSLL